MENQPSIKNLAENSATNSATAQVFKTVLNSAILATALSLSACGGGGGSGSDTPQVTVDANSGGDGGDSSGDTGGDSSTGIYDSTFSVGSDKMMDLSVAKGAGAAAEISVLKKSGLLLKTSLNANDQSLTQVKDTSNNDGLFPEHIASFKQVGTSNTLIATCHSGDASSLQNNFPWQAFVTPGYIDLHMSDNPTEVISISSADLEIERAGKEYQFVGCQSLEEASLSTDQSGDLIVTMSIIAHLVNVTTTLPIPGDEITSRYALMTLSLTLDNSINTFGWVKSGGNISLDSYNYLHAITGIGDQFLAVTSLSDSEHYIAAKVGYGTDRENVVYRYTPTNGLQKVFESATNPFNGSTQHWKVTDMQVTADNQGVNMLYLVSDTAGLIAIDLDAVNTTPSGTALPVSLAPTTIPGGDYDQCIDVLTAGYNGTLICHDSSDPGHMLEFSEPQATNVVGMAQLFSGKEEAEQIKAELEGAGAEVEVK